jgi:uncharacterized protein (TIGR02646 family)
MIHRERSGVPPPDILTHPEGKGAAETAKAKSHYEKKAALKRRKAFAFACYRSPEVKRALADLFHGKCAYCESRYEGTQPVDVEHWRPKAKIVEGEEEIEPGYYWLAADWDNLLPSCIDCNRERTQVLTPTGEIRTVGKANRFPLEPGSVRARTQNDVALERPLLLNPCYDHPEEHLEFIREAVVRPRRQSSGALSLKGEVSIEVYALNRTGLVQSRFEILLLIQQRMYTIKRLLEILDSEDLDESIQVIAEDLLGHELEALSRFRHPDQPYSQMARQAIDPFIAQLTH